MTNFDHGFSSDLLWKTLWESTNDGLILVNLEGYTVACNSAMSKFLKYRTRKQEQLL
ncbi:MAG: hypothetical protein HOH83_01970 [Deltaproteobacteria bacterium]|nr:hypothetical protein [Deltaproteobacteria bacterium]